MVYLFCKRWLQRLVHNIFLLVINKFCLFDSFVKYVGRSTSNSYLTKLGSCNRSMLFQYTLSCWFYKFSYTSHKTSTSFLSVSKSGSIRR